MKTTKRIDKSLLAPAGKENGSAIVAALLVLVLLTIFGMTSLSTTDSDLQVVSGERAYLNTFFVAESSWKAGAQWLNNYNTDPPIQNNNIVKYFGTTTSEPATLDDTNKDQEISGIPYWYKLTFIESKSIPGESSRRRYYYTVEANADLSQTIIAEVSKVFDDDVTY